jgi:hypothetical protein
MLLPSTAMLFSVCVTSLAMVLWTESYLSRYASVAAPVRSFTATKSMSYFFSSAARRTLRPMRPNPFTPTFTI